KGAVYREGEFPFAFPRLVSPGYIESMGIRLVKGRSITERDRADTENVALLNEAAAQRLWPNEDPIGRKILQNDESTVVGVVANVRHSSVEEEADLEMYFPM